jgi:hypothetical protein
LVQILAGVGAYADRKPHAVRDCDNNTVRETKTMNREFLKQAGVPDEAIDKVMAEYGKDIQAEKDRQKQSTDDADAIRQELETYKAKVADLEKASEGSDAVKKELEDLKARIAEEKRLADEKSADEQLTKTIKAAFPQDRKFVNEYTEAAYIGQIKAELNKPENKGKGISEIFETLTKDKADIFQNPNQVSNMTGFGGTDINAVDDAKVRRIMGLPVNKE